MPKRPAFDKLRAALHQLNLDQARHLYAELSTIVQALEQEAATPAPVEAKGREVVETAHASEMIVNDFLQEHGLDPEKYGLVERLPN